MIVLATTISKCIVKGILVSERWKYRQYRSVQSIMGASLTRWQSDKFSYFYEDCIDLIFNKDLILSQIMNEIKKDYKIEI